MSHEDKKVKHSDFIREIISRDLKSGKHKTIITRFPPEPNGYLHIGHAKAICLSFGIAQENKKLGAQCHLRFDDTNPEKEEDAYVQSIIEDVRWLGFDWENHLYFASDYFDFFYECAKHLIKNGMAYVDEQSHEEIRKNRGSVTTPGVPSPYRERPIEESLMLFQEMKSRKHKEGSMVLRAKIDLSSSNMNMRDPVIYRIMHTRHHRTADKWPIYPMYDFAHPLEDALEKITHSLCTLEFENHRPLYNWFIKNCPVPATPRQIEFSRLSLSYTIMSKRKLLELVQGGYSNGWDDPRMPTLSGMRRRGYPPEAIRNFCKHIGITKVNSITDISLLEEEVRKQLNKKAERRMAVLNPVKLVITNWPGGNEMVDLPNNPANSTSGTRKVALGKEIWIERDDFMEDPTKKFFRLGPGRSVRLRGGYIITCTNFKKSQNGEIVEVHCERIEDTIGKDPPEGITCRAAIHWVDVCTSIDAELRLYDRLFSEENPDVAQGGFLTCLNPHSLDIIKNAKLEASLAHTKPEELFQFERVGYFCADSKDHSEQKPVFNRTASLRDSWGKQKRV